MSEHTKGRLEAFTQESFSGWYALRDQDHFEVGSGDGGFDEADARRLAAAWNVCIGFDTESLENILMLGDTMHSRFSALKAECDQAHRELATARALLQQQDALLGNKACATKECRELLAARALLREMVECNWTLDPFGAIKKHKQAKDYLDACDTLEGAPNAG